MWTDIATNEQGIEGMAGLEPPVPAIAANNFDDGRSAVDTESGSVGDAWSVRRRFGKVGKRTVGLFMLAIVVFLWTASNFLASVSTTLLNRRER